METTKIRAGKYEVKHNNKKFRVEKFPNDLWYLFDETSTDSKFWSTWSTKKEAKRAIERSA